MRLFIPFLLASARATAASKCRLAERRLVNACDTFRACADAPGEATGTLNPSCPVHLLTGAECSPDST